MSTLIDILTSGGLGTAIGAIGSLGDKFLTRKIELEKLKLEYRHVKSMHMLQAQQEQRKAEYDLLEAEIKGEYVGLESSIKHDMSIEKVHPVANTVRALFRPFITTVLVLAVYTHPQPELFSGFAGLSIAWWMGSRSHQKKAPRNIL